MENETKDTNTSDATSSPGDGTISGDKPAEGIRSSKKAKLASGESEKPKDGTTTGSEESEAEEAVNSEPTELEISYKKISLRGMLERARSLGARITNYVDRNSVINALQEVGHNPDDDYIPEDFSDHWEFLSTDIGEGPVTATDPTGVYEAVCYPTGRTVLTIFNPAKASRAPGIKYAKDQVIEVQSLEELTHKLYLLLDETDTLFEKNSAGVLKSAQDREALLRSGVDPDNPDVDPRIAILTSLCEKHGFTGKFMPTLNKMPRALCQAYGLNPYYTEEQEKPDPDDNIKTVKIVVNTAEKPWDELANEIIAKDAEVTEVTAPSATEE